MPDPNRLDVLRCADQDREVVATLLNNAYADGRLTFDEHAERIARAYDAKTFGDLTALTTDLVVLEPPRPAPQPPLSAPSPLMAPSPSFAPAVPPPPSGMPVTAGAFTGGNALLSTFRSGRIGVVAGDVTLNTWLGDAKIDLVGAAYERRDTTIHVGGGLCDVKIRVPEGVDVNLSGMSLILADAKVTGLLPRPDGIRLNLVGTLFMGELKIVGPATDRRRYERFVR